jgi:hypothetical protein
MAFHISKDDGMRISIRFDANILPYVNDVDRDVLQSALRADHDTSHLMKGLSAELKDCILAIAGPQSADLLDVDPSSCSLSFLDLSHLGQTAEFLMQHISNLPPGTNGKRNGKGSPGDRIVIERLAGPPYLQGDYRAVDPKGAMDFAVSAFLRDVVWLNGSLALVSAEYLWHKQYLAERCNASILKNLLDNTIRFGMGDDTKTYGEAGTVYKAAASAPFRALNEISNQHRNSSIAIGGKNRSILRPGMGVFIEVPLSTSQHAGFHYTFGSITAMDIDSGNITVRLLLGRDDLPDYVLANLGGNDLVQTNAVLEVPINWVAGTFRLWPSLLFHAECVAQPEDAMANKFLSRVVVCDLQFSPEDEHVDELEGDKVKVTIEIFPMLLEGRLRLTLRRMKPFPAKAALAYIFHMHELEGGLNPPALAYKAHLGHNLRSFALQKAGQGRSAKNQHTFHPDMPARALLEMLHRTVPGSEMHVVISKGVLTVEVGNLGQLRGVFGMDPSVVDLRDDGYGVIEFQGPFIFKWGMYESTEGWGGFTGSLSISVGSFTEFNRMGTDVIKSSKCHPEALRGSGVEAPAKKKARTSKASPDTGGLRRTSQAQAQANERAQRLERRSVLSGGGSESTSPSDVSDVGRPSFRFPETQDGYRISLIRAVESEPLRLMQTTSQAQAQANVRAQGQERRSFLLGGGSESTSPSDVSAFERSPFQFPERDDHRISLSSRFVQMASEALAQAKERAKGLENCSVLLDGGSESTSPSDVSAVGRPSSPDFSFDNLFEGPGEQPAEGLGGPGA